MKNKTVLDGKYIVVKEDAELEVGKLYSDGCRDEAILEFIGLDDDNDPYFRYVDGRDGYSKNSDGTIPFYKSTAWNLVELKK